MSGPGPIRTWLQGTEQLEEALEWVYEGQGGLAASSLGVPGAEGCRAGTFWSPRLESAPLCRSPPPPHTGQQEGGPWEPALRMYPGWQASKVATRWGWQAPPLRGGGPPLVVPGGPCPWQVSQGAARVVLPKVTIPSAWSLPEPSRAFHQAQRPGCSCCFWPLPHPPPHPASSLELPPPLNCHLPR